VAQWLLRSAAARLLPGSIPGVRFYPKFLRFAPYIFTTIISENSEKELKNQKLDVFMAIHNFGKLEYYLVDFSTGEVFDDGRNNPNPHRIDAPRYNGHNYNSVSHIDPSLNGATPKQALDFLAKSYPRDFVKEHSRVSTAHATAIYHMGHEGINHENHWFKGEFRLEIPIDVYIKMGKPEKICLPLQIETSDKPVKQN
jgi:hypothetical protein